MRKINSIYLLLIVFIVISCQTQPNLKAPYTVVFYNVENLFDTIDAPNKMDEEFMPNAPKEWNTIRYQKKINDLALVLSSIDTINLPILIGVCEIENDKVLTDLVNQPLLQKANYEMVWEDGLDFRGIDCALLYNPTVFKVSTHELLKVQSAVDPDFITRDVLYVQGLIGKELFHVFVNHWPSRRGGAEISEAKRILAASVVRKKVDEIYASDEMANIIIMGDMNDEPDDMSLSDVLIAIPNKTTPEDKQLVNLMYDDFEQGLGSYSYKGNWDAIDNIIVSSALITKEKGLKSKLNNGFIFHQPFMEYVAKDGAISPNRTYGRTYYGGISDHFPVYMVLE